MSIKQKWLNGLIFTQLGCLLVLITPNLVEASQTSSNYLGTFEGKTTFIATSSSQVTPELMIEVMDDEGNPTQYRSEEGVISLSDTQEGTYVTQAQLLGQTFYIDQETGDRLETFEENRTLKLESVENPGLKILSEEHFNHMDLEKGTISGLEGEDADASISGETVRSRTKGMRELKGSKTVLFSENLEGIPKFLFSYDEDGNYLGRTPEGWEEGTEIETKEGAVYYRVAFAKYLEDIPKTMYIIPEGHDVSEISSVESFSLSKLNDKQDCFNLKTGEITQEVGEVLMKGTSDEDWTYSTNHDRTQTKRYNLNVGLNQFVDCSPDSTDIRFLADFKMASPSERDIDKQAITIVQWESASDCVSIRVNRDTVDSLVELKGWLALNPIKLYYERPSIRVEQISLVTTYRFPQVNKTHLKVKGEILPIVTSVTLPTEPLTFVLNPNQEVGQQFVAPEFKVTNESNAPLTLTLKTFEQTSALFNDVPPTYYESWDELTKEQSKDIALGLVSKSSTDWLNRVDETHYVSETNNEFVGTIKPKGTVGFEFIAHHGQAFDEILNPSYHLTFVFDLLN